MTNQEANQLRPGDTVYWTDPDDGISSGYYQVYFVSGDIVHLTSDNGSDSMAIASELSWKEPC